MTPQESTVIVKMFEGNVPFFPRDEAAQALVADELISMGATIQQGMWLVRRYAQLYRDWQFRELRALYCSRFRPADGVEAYSAIFVEGVPSEKVAAWKSAGAIEGGRAPLQIEGQVEQISADEDLAAEVRKIAAATSMPTLRRPRTKEEIEKQLYSGKPKPAPPEKSFSQQLAEIEDKARESGS